jgi:glycosyltransferase involved in cell wall biosynthesis
MINNKKVVVVLPAYNAAKTLEITYSEIDFTIVDDVILVDDRSRDNTVEVGRQLGINHIIVHEHNKGYGGNQKSCYNKALEIGADIVIMLHPDYQYTPKLIPAMASLLGSGLYHVVLGSRILGKGALAGGMPMIKYISNRGLTLIQNILMNAKLSEYHTGYRAFTREVLEAVNYNANSDNFVFDNQMLAQIWYAGYEIAEITCPTKYFDDASSINLKNSTIYALGVLKTSMQFRLQKWGLGSFDYLKKKSENRLKLFQNTLLKYIIPILLFLVAFVWKVMYIGARDICLDEPFTIFNAQLNLLDIIKLPANNEPTPPLFMMILHFWIKIFGIGAYSVRIVPILFNAFTAVFLYLIGKKFFNSWSGLIASGLFIFSTYHFYFGGDTRTYAMLSFATAAALYYFLSIAREPEKKIYAIGLVISNLMLIYGHYFGWFVVFMEFVSAFFFLKNREFLKKTAISILATAVLYIPMMPVLYKQFFISKGGTWLAPPTKSQYIHELKYFMNDKNAFYVLIGILALGIILALFRKPGTNNLKTTALFFLWWIVPYSIMFLVSFKIPMFTNRYILFNTIGLYLFAGFAIAYLFQKFRILVPLAGLVLLVVMYMNMYTEDFAPRGVKKTSDFIRTKANPESTVVIYAHWADLGFMYYYNQDIFKSVYRYEELLAKNNIYRTWGVDDAKIFVEEKKPARIIFYQNNTTDIDPENQVFKYFDSVYARTDSVPFYGGLVVSIFTKKELEEETTSSN